MGHKSIGFFPPAAFTAVMGTGVLAIATLEMSRIAAWLYWAAQVLNIFNFVLFGILAVIAFISWTKNFHTLRATFEQPDSSSLYAACGLAILVLAAQALRFGFGECVSLFIWWCGALVTLSFNFGMLLRFFLHRGTDLIHVGPVIFVPIAGLVVIPVAGTAVSAYLTGWARELAIVICLVGIGGGLALYMGLFAMVLQRHLLAMPLPDQLLPTLWIHVAPLGWGGVSLVGFARFILPGQFAPTALFMALLLFGAAFWWLIMSALICLRAVAIRKLSFSLAWWSFIFPIGSITILANCLDFSLMQKLFPILWGLLGLLWLICVMKTAWMLKNKAIIMQAGN